VILFSDQNILPSNMPVPAWLHLEVRSDVIIALESVNEQLSFSLI